MKTVNISLGNLAEVKLHAFSDWHIGDKACKIADIRAMIAEVTNSANDYVILNGDLMNNATKASVSDCYAEELTPMEQLATLRDLLEPIKDKILMATCGNHEARTYKADGIDLMALLMRELGIEERYCREGGVLFLHLGAGCDRHKNRPYTYSLYVTHGSGGGRKEGAKAVRLADMASIVDVDIYIHSHTHLPMIMKQSFFRTNLQGASVAQVDKLFVNTSSLLDYGGYGQTYEFKPNSTANPVIYLNGRKREYQAKL